MKKANVLRAIKNQLPHKCCYLSSNMLLKQIQKTNKKTKQEKVKNELKRKSAEQITVLRSISNSHARHIMRTEMLWMMLQQNNEH